MPPGVHPVHEAGFQRAGSPLGPDGFYNAVRTPQNDEKKERDSMSFTPYATTRDHIALWLARAATIIATAHVRQHLNRGLHIGMVTAVNDRRHNDKGERERT